MRGAKFDLEEVLSSAMDAFISKGYSKTSMQDLKKATGLHPGSIYHAFSNKRGLLLASLEHYRTERSAEFQALFDKSPTVLAGIHAYLDYIVAECEREEIKDCLLQKVMSELSQQDDEAKAITSQMVVDWQKAFTDKLIEAQNAGEIDQTKDCQALSQFLVMGIYGIRVFSHTKPEIGVLRNLAGQLLEYIGK